MSVGDGSRNHTASNGQPKRILVTGGAGYIGSHLVRKLLARGHGVRVVDNYLYGAHGLHDLFGQPRLEVIKGDIRCAETMTSAAQSVDTIIALAALVGDAACELDPDESVSVNLEATRLLTEVSRRAGVRRVVFASTCSVYGANSNDLLDENSWTNPVSLYAKTRIQSEEVLLGAADDLSVTILRLATVFGLSSRMRLDLFMNTFTASAFFKRKIQVFGGRQWRPNVHVQDAAEAFILAAEACDEKVRGEVFNVGDDALNYTVLEIARRVQAELPEAEVETTDAATEERNYRVTFAKIHDVLGFSPRHLVRDGIREMIRAFSTWKMLPGDERRYSNYLYLKTYGCPSASLAGGVRK